MEGLKSDHIGKVLINFAYPTPPGVAFRSPKQGFMTLNIDRYAVGPGSQKKIENSQS